MPDINTEPAANNQYDAHRLIFHMSIGGVLICALGLLVAVIGVYQDIGLNIINLRIDKLGDYLSSPLAYVYNIGLLFSGASFTLAMFGLYLLRYNTMTHYLALSGGCAGIGISLLGIYPYNDPTPHRLAAIFFIASTLIMFLLLVFTRRRYPWLCNFPLFIVSLLGVCFSITLFMQMDSNSLDYRECTAGAFCYPAFNLWIHTLLTMLAGIGLAITAKNLLDQAIQARNTKC